MKETDTELASGRLSEERLVHLQKKAVRFRQLVHWIANKKVGQQQFESVNGAMFEIAAELIKRKTDRFCKSADDEFDELEAHGQEPKLDDDWLDDLTGIKSSFYFSTESLVQALPKLPRQERTQRQKGELNEDQMAQVVQEAVQSFEEAMAVSHIEKPQQWIDMISRALEQEGGEANFWHLQRLTQLSPGALFLGLLLGHQNWITTQINFDENPEFYASFTVKTDAAVDDLASAD